MSYEAEVMFDAPVNWWRLGDTGNQTDKTGGLTLTPINSPTDGVAGLLPTGTDTAVSFVDTSSQYLINNTADFRIGDTQGSIEAWFSSSANDALDVSYAIFSSSDTSIERIVSIDLMPSGSVRLFFQGFLLRNIKTTSTSFNDGNPHHVVVTSNGSRYKIYVDGADEPFTVLNGPDDGRWFDTVSDRDNVVVGCRKDFSGGQYYFDGTIDEVAIYNAELSLDRIEAHYQAGAESLSIAGVVTDDDGQPAARTVRAYRRSSGVFLAETTSSAVDGSYTLSIAGSGEVQRIALADDVAEGVVYNDKIDRVIPG